jgi:hypothetical protein
MRLRPPGAYKFVFTGLLERSECRIGEYEKISQKPELPVSTGLHAWAPGCGLPLPNGRDRPGSARHLSFRARLLRGADHGSALTAEKINEYQYGWQNKKNGISKLIESHIFSRGYYPPTGFPTISSVYYMKYR